MQKTISSNSIRTLFMKKRLCDCYNKVMSEVYLFTQLRCRILERWHHPRGIGKLGVECFTTNLGSFSGHVAKTKAEITRWKILWESTTPAKAIADCHHNGGCAVNGSWNSRCCSVDRPITFLDEFAYSLCSLDSRKTTQLRNLWVFVADNWQHLPHLLLEV